MLLTPVREVTESVVKLARKQAGRLYVRIEIFPSNDATPVMIDAEQMKSERA
jgi:hypothetical protein